MEYGALGGAFGVGGVNGFFHASVFRHHAPVEHGTDTEGGKSDDEESDEGYHPARAGLYGVVFLCDSLLAFGILLLNLAEFGMGCYGLDRVDQRM